jgi:Tol biopolymer transport system component
MRRILIRAATLACALACPVAGTQAQYLTRPHLDWQTIETPGFSIHFPAEMREWATDVARRIESVAEAVNAVVGHAPAARVTVLVEDPSSASNGFAVPLLEGPVMFLWPTPPSPSPTFGAHRGWGEILAVHEYAHIAHLTIPTRNPRERLFWRFMPARLGPVARNAPPWVFEGYATLIEGRLTGSGRPASVGRAAVLRQWALEGKLPTYSQLNATGSFLGGSMRYLIGSAFLEWLQARKGDSSLVHLWRRMSARVQRSFPAAFTGVYGAPPEDLYGRFYVDVMARAIEIGKTLTDAGLVEGELVQRLSEGTGDPAVSPDGKRLALVVRTVAGPPRLVVWSADAEPEDTGLARARARLRERDPLDVPAIDSFPRPRRAIATLYPAAGRSHELPRWMPDGVHLLVSRNEPTGDGASRPDLFLWNYRTGRVSRVTRGAAIRHADPSPDGRRAAAVRCHVGICSLVLVDLATGVWRELAAGSPDVVWHRPRWSPDGSLIAAGRQSGGRWEVALVDAATGAVRRLAPGEPASRYAPSFTRSGRELVLVCERGGVPNLELHSIETGAARPLTRVMGAVAAPEVRRSDGRIYFLSLHARGYDLRRILIDSVTPADPVVALPSELAPVSPQVPLRGPVTFGADPVRVRGYGLGPRRWRVLPGVLLDPDGLLGMLMVANVDPISRFSVVAQGGFGQPGTARGGSLAMALRQSAVGVQGTLWHLDHRPSASEDGVASPDADLRFTGAGALAELSREYGLLGFGLGGAASYGEVDTPQLEGAARWMISGDVRARLTIPVRRLTVAFAGTGAVTAGSTGGDAWNQSMTSASVVVSMGGRYLRGDVVSGSASLADPGEAGSEFEHFLVGGSGPPYMDRAFLSQRVAVPAVPTGYAAGRRIGLYRVAMGRGGFEPYFLWVAAGDRLSDWKRVAGLEQTLAFPSLGFARLPAVRLRLGGGYSFDEPFKYRVRGYAGVIYRP